MLGRKIMLGPKMMKSDYQEAAILTGLMLKWIDGTKPRDSGGLEKLEHYWRFASVDAQAMGRGKRVVMSDSGPSRRPCKLGFCKLNMMGLDLRR